MRRTGLADHRQPFDPKRGALGLGQLCAGQLGNLAKCEACGLFMKRMVGHGLRCRNAFVRHRETCPAPVALPPARIGRIAADAGYRPRATSPIQFTPDRELVAYPLSMIGIMPQKLVPPPNLKTWVRSYLPLVSGTAKSNRRGPNGDAQMMPAPTELRRVMLS